MADQIQNAIFCQLITYRIMDSVWDPWKVTQAIPLCPEQSAPKLSWSQEYLSPLFRKCLQREECHCLQKPWIPGIWAPPLGNVLWRLNFSEPFPKYLDQCSQVVLRVPDVLGLLDCAGTVCCRHTGSPILSLLVQKSTLLDIAREYNQDSCSQGTHIKDSEDNDRVSKGFLTILRLFT